MFRRRPFAGGCEAGREALRKGSLVTQRIDVWWEGDQNWCEGCFARAPDGHWRFVRFKSRRRQAPQARGRW